MVDRSLMNLLASLDISQVPFTTVLGTVVTWSEFPTVMRAPQDITSGTLLRSGMVTFWRGSHIGLAVPQKEAMAKEKKKQQT